MADEVAKADTRYLSRKFRFSVASWLAGTVVWGLGVFTGKVVMTTDQWIYFTQWILGLYMAGNVGDTLATGLANVFTPRQ